jgi:hypothetical protein
MGTFVSVPSATNLLSANADLEIDYYVNSLVSIDVSPSVVFEIEINGTTQTQKIAVNAFYRRLTLGTLYRYFFKLNLSEYVKDFFDNNLMFTASNFPSVTGNYKAIVNVTATDWVSNTDGLLIEGTSVTSSDFTAINALKMVVDGFVFDATLINFLTNHSNYDVIKVNELQYLAVWTTTAVNSFQVELLGSTQNYLGGGDLYMNTANNINLVNISTNALANYNYRVSSDTPITNAIKFLRFTAGFATGGNEFIARSNPITFVLDHSTCDYLKVAFQNELGTIDTVYFEQFDQRFIFKKEQYQKNATGLRQLSGTKQIEFTISETLVTEQRLALLRNVFSSGVVYLTYESIIYEVVTDKEINLDAVKFDKGYSIQLIFLASESLNVFNN